MSEANPMEAFTAELPKYVIDRMREKLADEMATALQYKLSTAVNAEVERFITEEVAPLVREEVKTQAPDIAAAIIRSIHAACATLEAQLTKRAVDNLTEKYGAMNKVTEAIFGKGY